MKNSVVILIDFNNYFTRFYYSNKETCVERYLKFLKDVVQKFNPQWLINLIDAERNFRYDIFPEYKKNRPNKEEDFEEFRNNCLFNLEKLNWPTQNSKTLEAEDLANIFIKNNPQIHFIVLSNDKDCLQMESNNCLIFNYIGEQKKSTETNESISGFERKSFKNLDLETSEEFLLFLSLKGDSSDNIPGVDGIGDKGAKKLAKKYKNFQVIKNKIKNPKTGFLALAEQELTKDLDKVRQNFDSFELSYNLIKLFEGEWKMDLGKYRI